MLAAGAVLLVPAAPAFAVSGSAAGVDASAAQYKSSSDDPDPGRESSVPLAEEVAPAVVQEAPQQAAPPEDVALPLGEETPTEEAAPAAREVAGTVTVLQSKTELPFTGYLVLLVLGAGIASLTAGVVLRRATSRRTDSG